MSPTCIGIIMDGNRRWAKAHNLPTFEGHRRGFEKVKEIAEWAKSEGISCLILFAFSTENWNRTKDEVSYLMNLFETILTKEIETLQERGIRVRCIGEQERFSPELRVLMRQAEERTAGNQALTLALCLSYGGLIIRPGGQFRLSGFLPWQSIYSELFFTKTLWPDFSEEEFKTILNEFAQRDRRVGR